MDGCYTAALWLQAEGIHLLNLVKHEEQLSVAGARCGIYFFLFTCKIGQTDKESVIHKKFSVINEFLVLFPRLAIRRIGHGIAKVLTRKIVFPDGVAQNLPFRIYALDDKVRHADGISLRVDFSSR